MRKPRKPAAPAREPLPSLEELQEAYWPRRAECLANHKHTPAELRECDRRIAVDWRVAEFRRRVALFFDKIHPGKTIHTLPEGAFQRELDRIAESLSVRPRLAEDSAHLTHILSSIRPAPIPMHLKNPGATAAARRAFDRAVKAGKPVKVVVENHTTGEKRVEWQVWSDPSNSNSSPRRLVPTVEAVRGIHDNHPDWGAPAIARVLGCPDQVRTVSRRLAAVKKTLKTLSSPA